MCAFLCKLRSKGGQLALSCSSCLACLADVIACRLQVCVQLCLDHCSLALLLVIQLGVNVGLGCSLSSRKSSLDLRHCCVSTATCRCNLVLRIQHGPHHTSIGIICCVSSFICLFRLFTQTLGLCVVHGSRGGKNGLCRCSVATLCCGCRALLCFRTLSSLLGRQGLGPASLALCQPTLHVGTLPCPLLSELGRDSFHIAFVGCKQGGAVSTETLGLLGKAPLQ